MVNNPACQGLISSPVSDLFFFISCSEMSRPGYGWSFHNYSVQRPKSFRFHIIWELVTNTGMLQPSWNLNVLTYLYEEFECCQNFDIAGTFMPPFSTIITYCISSIDQVMLVLRCSMMRAILFTSASSIQGSRVFTKLVKFDGQIASCLALRLGYSSIVSLSLLVLGHLIRLMFGALNWANISYW